MTLYFYTKHSNIGLFLNINKRLIEVIQFNVKCESNAHLLIVVIKHAKYLLLWPYWLLAFQ